MRLGNIGGTPLNLGFISGQRRGDDSATPRATPARNNGPGERATPAVPADPIRGRGREVAEKLLAPVLRNGPESKQTPTNGDGFISREQDMQLHILERMFGFEGIRNVVIDSARATQIHSSSLSYESSLQQSNAAIGFEDHLHYESFSQFQYEMSGSFETEDGQRFEFDFSLDHQRSVLLERQRSIEAHTDMIDPLALDLDGNGISLAPGDFAFDIDLDGALDQLAELMGADAWLALDRNGNGNIDDGSELFGPASGNGFTELALLDDNQDGLINKDDEHFADLVLFRPGETLMSIEQAGIKVLSVEAQANRFNLFAAESHELLGRISQTSAFLAEGGRGGGLHHVDLIA